MREEALEGDGAMLGTLRRSWGAYIPLARGEASEDRAGEKQSVAMKKTTSTNHNGRPQECESADPQAHTPANGSLA